TISVGFAADARPVQICGKARPAPAAAPAFSSVRRFKAEAACINLVEDMTISLAACHACHVLADLVLLCSRAVPVSVTSSRHVANLEQMPPIQLILRVT